MPMPPVEYQDEHKMEQIKQKLSDAVIHLGYDPETVNAWLNGE